MNNYHQPVLLNDCIEGLRINPSGVYVDVTFGGGGHSKAILNQLNENGRLVAFDQDDDAYANRPDDERLIFVKQNFRYLKNYLKFYKIAQVDGILADLGVSSHQFDTAERGFSIRFDGDLDMRMNQNSPLTAAKILNEYSEENLANVLYQYGEIKESRKIARAVGKSRIEKPIETIDELKKLINPFAKKFKESQFLAQVFQALRIEVNEELVVLKEMLMQAVEVLKPGGRLVVMSYHSLEDRLVKNLIKTGNFEGTIEKDFFGNYATPLEAVNRKVIIPSEEEIEKNNRARSAKLRIAEKI